MAVATSPFGIVERIEAIAGRTIAWFDANGTDVMIAAAATIVVYALLAGLRALVRKLAGKPEDHPPHSWREIVARIIWQTRNFALGAVALASVLVAATLPPSWQAGLHTIFVAAGVVQVAIWVREFVFAIIERRSSLSGHDSAQLASAMGVIRLIGNVVIWAVAAIVVLDNMGVNVGGLVAGLGIGGIAIGLAAQGIFSDLFAALSILFDKPFVKGDTITIDTLTGTVESIGLKTTRLRALTGEMVAISNAKLLENRIHNLAEYSRRRVSLPVGVTYQTSPALLERLPEEIRAVIEGVHNTDFNRAHMSAFGPSSIDIDIVFDVNSVEFNDMLTARHAVMLGLIRRFAELGVDFAYPTQTTFTAAPDGSLVMPYPEPAVRR